MDGSLLTVRHVGWFGSSFVLNDQDRAGEENGESDKEDWELEGAFVLLWEAEDGFLMTGVCIYSPCLGPLIQD